jgi:hypothetical protein
VARYSFEAEEEAAEAREKLDEGFALRRQRRMRMRRRRRRRRRGLAAGDAAGGENGPEDDGSEDEDGDRDGDEEEEGTEEEEEDDIGKVSGESWGERAVRLVGLDEDTGARMWQGVRWSVCFK